MKKIMFNDKYCLTQAVLNGTKTMTRRAVRRSLQDEYDSWYEDFLYKPVGEEKYLSVEEYVSKRTAYKVGEIVAIAQSYHNLNKSGYTAPEWLDHVCESSAGYENKMFVRADLMPHHIRITDVKAERLQDISDKECLREGVKRASIGFYAEGVKVKDWEKEAHRETASGCLKLFPFPREAFAELIDKVCGRGTWESNPLVVAYSFELVD
ncbi:hypothetical protein [Segatella oris]|uniref:Uncharacterized protein n=1 Tax=Segatella oris C735 TaxID=563008 RepID=D7NFS1_9BACT|nr:hypothetical protein [Segatella oris]EFI47557.1 conserved hypothetical protein [Segatella oris C735]